ncbi:citrate-binding protein-like [Punica granatum]|uniref:Citrate-binding protein-like n=1 Tax=Punica granatum TaxID=22663 RepID=A0A6P8BXA2_PUNGR|nr:citrate-binding protein-like [Punica granatum]
MDYIQGLDYLSGVWQLEGHAFVPNGTSRAIIVQIHGGEQHATTLILRINEGDVHYYLRDLGVVDVYDRWFRVNIIHEMDEETEMVFFDGVQKLVTEDCGPGDLFFKCGVYAAPPNVSYYLESRWRDIKIYKK